MDDLLNLQTALTSQKDVTLNLILMVFSKLCGTVVSPSSTRATSHSRLKSQFILAIVCQIHLQLVVA